MCSSLRMEDYWWSLSFSWILLKRTLVIWWTKISQHQLSVLPSCPPLTLKSVQSLSSLSSHAGGGSISYSVERSIFFSSCQTRLSWLSLSRRDFPNMWVRLSCGGRVNEGLGHLWSLKINSFDEPPCVSDQINLILNWQPELKPARTAGFNSLKLPE